MSEGRAAPAVYLSVCVVCLSLGLAVCLVCLPVCSSVCPPVFGLSQVHEYFDCTLRTVCRGCPTDYVHYKLVVVGLSNKRYDRLLGHVPTLM
jgi:hypothetical protein